MKRANPAKPPEMPEYLKPEGPTRTFTLEVEEPLAKVFDEFLGHLQFPREWYIRMMMRKAIVDFLNLEEDRQDPSFLEPHAMPDWNDPDWVTKAGKVMRQRRWPDSDQNGYDSFYEARADAIAYGKAEAARKAKPLANRPTVSNPETAALSAQIVHGPYLSRSKRKPRTAASRVHKPDVELGKDFLASTEPKPEDPLQEEAA